MFRKYIGDRSFYRRVMQIGIPIMIQNGITNFVSLLDNIMVGQIGTMQMGGVAVVNQLIFVFNLCIFGATSGAGIFTAQYYGKQDHDGIRHTFRIKFLIGLAFCAVFLGLFALCPVPLIRLYLQGEGSAADIAATLQYGRQYLFIMLFGLIPFALSSVYSTTLRECGQATIPMIAGTVAVFVNLFLNYVLIFGHFGAPAMGVQGAAIATVISRYVELAIVGVWTHLHHKEHPFIRGAYRSMYVPGRLLRQFFLRSTPLMINEILWALAVVFLNQCYSTCGLDVMNAVNISGTVVNLTNVVTQALGITIGILMGQFMGSGHTKEQVMDANRKLIFLALVCGILFGGVQASIATVFPGLYNTTASIRLLAAQMILITAICKPITSCMYCAYYTIRSGGKTVVTFLYDSGTLWVLTIPLAFCLSRFTDISILPLFILCQIPDAIKTCIGLCIVKKGAWVQNITV